MSGPDTIAVRAYTEKRAAKRRGGGGGAVNDTPSEWALVFDCETTIDAAQRLRVGAYQIRNGGTLDEEGLFFDGEALDPEELLILGEYARERDLRCLSRAEFVDWVFYKYGHERRGSIIGFNLPFDLSRIAIAHGPARGSMRGGFSFRLSSDARKACVRVKHLNRRASLIDFAKPQGQDTARGERKRGIKTPAHRGFFVDVSTLASALMSEGFSLERLCERLGVASPKGDSGGHGERLTPAYLDYVRRDVQATWECYVALKAKYAKHNLSTPLHRTLSEASIGKAYLKQMGIAPLLECQPDFPRDLFGKIMSAYYGGRAEVHWRRTICRVLYCDFKSMYPTVNALMGLWRFVIAERVDWREATAEAREILAEADAARFQDRATWPALAMIVRLRPDHDLFPVRAKYGDGLYTIGLNPLSYPGDLWMTLADCIVAKLMSGKAPDILEAIAFAPGPPQAGLKPIDVFGNAEYRVDPLTDDVFARFVDLRDEAKAAHDPLQQAIKIIANATSYGVFIEINRDDAPKSEPILVCGPDGAPREQRSKAIEQPGRYFNPLLGVLITGAARLMLALAENQAQSAGLDWAFCDTDSLALVKPENMSEADFSNAAQSVVNWFIPLNPYRKPGSILKMEDVNFGKDGEHLPLYCFAISAKRYALFNIGADGAPVIRKASAHGLGHFMPPYTEADAPREIPPPAFSLSEIGVERWQYDLWLKIIEAALAGKPDQVALDYHPALDAPALSRFGITSPHLERWIRFWNEGRDYLERARPFGFMVTFQASRVAQNGAETAAPPKRGRPKKVHAPKPIAPFNRNPAKAVLRAFDRETGAPLAADALQSYAQALAQYHLHPEDKFLGGDYLDRGLTKRRYVRAQKIILIGKEANKWEEQFFSEVDDIARFG